MKGNRFLIFVFMFTIMPGGILLSAKEMEWEYVSTETGAMEAPNAGNQQTASQVLDIDKDGIDDFVITERTKSPSVVWYKYAGNKTWKKYVIEQKQLNIEAGGAHYDIDGDGDLDIVFCGDSRNDGVWWWENPYPKYDGGKGWKQHGIKKGDNARYQHDCEFADFDGDGKVELAWWSQTAKRLYLAEMPAKPRTVDAWEHSIIFTWKVNKGHEGMGVADMNLDDVMDIVGAGYWFEHVGVGKYQPYKICDRPVTRTGVGQIILGGRPEVVINPGDADGPMEWYEWNDGKWVGHQLMKEIIHGHSLVVRDINGDGDVDIFTGEMGRPGAGEKARTIIFWGNGKGDFEMDVIAVGKANHESKLGDFDGDGDIDILSKPYNYGSPGLHLWLQK